MSDLTDFQKEHGAEWNAITHTPAFQAAMSHLNLAKLAEISALTEDEIAKNGPLILAGLRDHLRHENDLMALGTQPDLNFRGVGPETYPDPLSEIELTNNGSEGTAKAEQPLQKKPRKRK